MFHVVYSHQVASFTPDLSQLARRVYQLQDATCVYHYITEQIMFLMHYLSILFQRSYVILFIVIFFFLALPQRHSGVNFSSQTKLQLNLR